jgi:GTP-binding protein YchF
MLLGIVGLPNSGKTTVFNALTGAQIETTAFSGAAAEANVAMVKIPDPRLDRLTEHYNPKKKTHVELKVMDFAPFQKGQGEKGFPAKHIGDLRTCDTLLLAVRAFEDESVPHPEDSVDAARDLETLLLELAMADIEVIERRIERIGDSWKRASKEERVKLDREKEFLQEIAKVLEAGEVIDSSKLDDDQKTMIRNFGLLTLKPLMAAINIHEDDLGADAAGKVRAVLPGADLPILDLAGKIEMEIAGLDAGERAEFLSDLGIAESARDRILRMAWERLGLIVFLTAGEDECRAWAIKKGDNAVTAAGKIHSDLARGFIRAEVAAYADFERHGNMQGVKDEGRYRLEGKDYIVQDGDIMQIRFNV